jgi:prepilin-type N-terminal cleavage/methylation domain-containing protein
MKAYKNIGFGPRKGKKGFTLIELLIVMVILAILAGVVVMAVGGVFGTSRETAYNTTKGELKNAVAQYASDHMGVLPVSGNTTYNITGTTPACDLINIDLLMVSVGGILAKAPDSCANVNGGNCTASAEVGSYTWVMDDYGNVYSACTGTKCSGGTPAPGNASGYTDAYIDPAYP